VLLLQVFLSESHSVTGVVIADTPQRNYVENCMAKIESIGLGPVKRADLVDVLSNKFAPERFRGVLDFGRVALGMSKAEVENLIQEVAFRCLEIGCKGRMLMRMVELHPFLEDAIRVHVVRNYRLDVGDLPPSDDVNGCVLYEAPLCQDFMTPRMTLPDAITELMHRTSGAAPSTSMEEGAVQTASSGDGEEAGGQELYSKATGNEDDDDDLVRKQGSVFRAAR
jgi:hypothetical protein